MRSKKYGEFLKTKLNNLPAVVTGSDLIIGLGFVRFDQTFSSKLNVVSVEATGTSAGQGGMQADHDHHELCLIGGVNFGQF